MACIRLFEGIKYVLPILHPNKKRLALIMCPEEDSASVEWARQKDENWVNKDITSLEFVENIFKIMSWNRECRYKILGRVQVLLEANGLAAGKDHQFKGRYDAEKNAVIISLEKDEQSALSPQKCTT